LGRIGTPLNDPHEAYTGNSMGRKEVRTLLKRFSLVIACAGGDDVKKSEAYTKGSKYKYGEILEGLSGSESMARRKRSVRNLGDPCVSCLIR